MTKKGLCIYLMIFVLLIGIMAPTFFHRAENEGRNNDVIFAVNYNNADMLLSDKELEKTLTENLKMGVNAALVGEESINSLISGGLITAIKYNVLCHKYDDESEEIIKALKNDENIHNDSYVLITKRNECKIFLDKWINAKYTNKEFVKLSTSLNADVYVIYQGINDAWHVAVGFDEKKLQKAYEYGFQVVPSLMVGAYSDITYVEYLKEIVEKYDVKYINLKQSYKDQNADKNAKKNYKALCSLIEENELYLILTENQTQLSNQKPIGYEKLIADADGRVLRGYETIDVDSANKNATISDKRYYQILNSVTDRNIRFVTINQLTNGTDTIAEKSDKTNDATKAAINKLIKTGYNTESYNMVYDYKVNRPLVSAAAMVLMIVMGLMVLEWLSGKRLPKTEIVAAAGAVLSVPFTYLAPDGIVLLYPTLFAVVAACFSITAVMVFAGEMRKKLSNSLFMILSVIFALLILAVCGFVQTVLLSGLDYYLNSIIFRGIKLSLIIPIAYCMAAFTIIFNRKDESFVKELVKILQADIKVYWVIIGGVLLGAGAVYLIRSGNVTSISPIENLMRNTITELMTERPRTKEFLIGWPCLVLMLYYIKNTNCKVVQWFTAVGASVLFASSINSFCHVFTTSSVIYMRLINGFIVGIVIGAAAYAINLLAVYLVKKGKEKWGII